MTLRDEGKYRTITEIAAVDGIDRGQASRIAQLTRLAPDIVEARVTNESTRLVLEHLIRRGGITATWVARGAN